MTATHILTVNAQTFNVHLNYMFAGTGKDNAEHQGGALADILAIRPKDNVVFYVIGYGFYGLFKVKHKNNPLVFYEHPSGQYLDSELGGKTLTYRFFIEPNPCGVYENGVNEWDAIENPERILDKKIYNMQWSWIFKKLKAKRGCVSIPEEEYQLLKQIITVNNEMLPVSNQYQFANGIISPCQKSHQYRGDTNQPPQLHNTPNTIKTEEDLRIFFCNNAGRDRILDEILRPNVYGVIKFIANEATCSFGEKRIDLLFTTKENRCLLLELKNNFEFKKKNLLAQLSGYARWVSSYKKHLPEIIPLLILREPKLYPNRRGCKKFQYLSRQDFEQKTISPWFEKKRKDLVGLKHDLNELRISKLAHLQVAFFQTDDNNKLSDFRFLDLSE
ncbi:MAG: hypothetical protein ABR969_08005 [Sedimentisphaerales bacterium]